MVDLNTLNVVLSGTESTIRALYWQEKIKEVCTYSLTHSLTHLLTHSLTHSLTYSLTYLLTHSLTHSLTHLLTHLLTYLLTHSRTHLLTYLLNIVSRGNWREIYIIDRATFSRNFVFYYC
jgi:hypothetical protein